MFKPAPVLKSQHFVPKRMPKRAQLTREQLTLTQLAPRRIFDVVLIKGRARATKGRTTAMARGRARARGRTVAMAMARGKACVRARGWTRGRVNPAPRRILDPTLFKGRARGRLSGVGALWDCVLRVYGSGGGCAGGGVPLGAVLALSWCGEVSLGGILSIIGRARTTAMARGRAMARCRAVAMALARGRAWARARG